MIEDKCINWELYIFLENLLSEVYLLYYFMFNGNNNYF